MRFFWVRLGILFQMWLLVGCKAGLPVLSLSTTPSLSLPNSVVAAGTVTRLSLNGGFAPYTFQVVGPSGSSVSTDSSGASWFNAPSTPGSVQITVTDRLNKTSQISVQVMDVSGVNSSLSGLTTVTSGMPSVITVTAKDSTNLQWPVGGLSVAFTLTSGTGNGFLGAVTDNKDGTYQVSILGTLAGSVTVQASINGTNITSGSWNGTVQPGAPSPATSLLSVFPSSIQSGSSTTFSLQLKDAAGNTISGPGPWPAVTFSVGGSCTPTSPTGGRYGGTAVYTQNFTGILAGTNCPVTATLGGSPVTSTGTVTVTAGPASAATSLLAVGSSSIQSGTSTNFSLTLRDAATNLIPTPGPAVVFSVGGTCTPSNPAGGSYTGGVYNLTFTGAVAGNNCPVTATLGGSAVTSSQLMSITPGTPSSSTSTVTITPTAIISGGASALFKITMRDASSNTWTTSPGIPVSNVTFTVNAPCSGVMSATTNNNDGTYSANFSGIGAGVGCSTVAKISGVSITPAPPNITVSSAGLDHIGFVVGPTIEAWVCNPVSVTAYDLNGNPTNVTSNTNVTINSTLGGAFYSDSVCTVPIGSTTILNGTSSQTVYLQDKTNPDSPNLSGTAPAAPGGVQALSLSTVITSVGGDGLDGNQSISAAIADVTVGTVGGRTFSAARKVTAISGSTQFTVGVFTVGTDFAVNDEVMWHVIGNGTPTSCDNGGTPTLLAGKFGFRHITSIPNNTTIVIDTPVPANGTIQSANLSQPWHTPGTAFCNIQVLRIPNFNNLTLNGASATATPFTTGNGYGGVVAFRARTITMTGAATFSADARGFTSALGNQGVGSSGLAQSNASANGTGGGSVPLTGGAGGGANGGAGGNGAGGSTPGIAGSPNCSPCTVANSPHTTGTIFLGGAGGSPGPGGATAGGTGGGIVMVFANTVSGAGQVLTLSATGFSTANDNMHASLPGGGAGGTLYSVLKNVTLGNLTNNAWGGAGTSSTMAASYGGGGGGGGQSYIESCASVTWGGSVNPGAGGSGTAGSGFAGAAGFANANFSSSYCP